MHSLSGNMLVFMLSWIWDSRRVVPTSFPEKKVFEMFISKKFKLDIFNKYPLSEIVKAHKDLEGRKILGPAIIIP